MINAREKASLENATKDGPGGGEREEESALSFHFSP